LALRPNLGPIPAAKHWRFSLRYWRQIEYFGIGGCTPGWFVSLLERLHELSCILLDDFLRDYVLKEKLRYHPIDWGSNNIPVKKENIDWLGGQGAAEDFELVQFHISKAMGRVIGFFDSEQVFQIVLLDPNHNMQPSMKYGYRVMATDVASSEMTSLIVNFQDIVVGNAEIDKEQKAALLDRISSQTSEITGGGIIVRISPEHMQKVAQLGASGVVTHLGELVELAIDDLEKGTDC
jgi:hypothetical protein